MTGINYVKQRLRQDFGERAGVIERLFDQRMSELLHPVSLEDDLNRDFHLLLDDLFYPFLACLQAMQDSGVDAIIADQYCRRIAKEMPMEKMDAVIERNLRKSTDWQH